MIGQPKILYDQEDAAFVEQYVWSISRRKTTNYATRQFKVGNKWKHAYLHRELMRPPDGMQVDHINGNGLDNRRCNLRIVTPYVNTAHNRKRPGKSGFKGVWPAPRSPGRWSAMLFREWKWKYLGTFDTPEEAHAAWKAAADAYEYQESTA